MGIPIACCYNREKPKGGWEVLGTMTGQELVGKTYTPLFPYFKDHPGEWWGTLRCVGPGICGTHLDNCNKGQRASSRM